MNLLWPYGFYFEMEQEVWIDPYLQAMSWQSLSIILWRLIFLQSSKENIKELLWLLYQIKYVEMN